MRAVLSLVALGAALLLTACGGDGASGEDLDEARAALRSVDDAVARVEAQATRADGSAGRRGREVRRLLEKWYATHTAVFAVDGGAAHARVLSVVNGLAEIAPQLVTADATGKPAEIDEAAVARALTPDPPTRALARRERPAIDHELDMLGEALGDQPADTIVLGEEGEPGGETTDEVLIALQDRLRLLFPRAAARVLQMRIDLPR